MDRSIHSIEIWVPHRISGFFQMLNPAIKKSIKDPLKIGSRGGGPSLNAFGKTIITALPIIKGNLKKYKISINGVDKSETALTSLSVLNLMKDQLPKEYNLNISHNFDLPVGCGYGSSGAGALGLACGLNYLFNVGLSASETAMYAHWAEVINHTGLGTVGGQFNGGFSISMEPGYPFTIDKILTPADTQIVIGTFNPIETKSILTDPLFQEEIYKYGTEAFNKLRKHFSLENYMAVCREFVNSIKILERLQLNTLKKLITELNTLDIYGASMNQIGEAVFAICTPSMVSQIKSVILKYNPPYPVQSYQICHHGPILHLES